MDVITVKLLAHQCSVVAALWLIDNIPHKDWVPQWGINNQWVDPATWSLEGRKNSIDILIYLINLNNNGLKKTHEVEFNFINEEDAVWFKTVWGN